MPELPEVEVCRKALAPALTGKRVSAVHAYCTNLRSPVPPLMKLIGGPQTHKPHAALQVPYMAL